MPTLFIYTKVKDCLTKYSYRAEKYNYTDIHHSTSSSSTFGTVGVRGSETKIASYFKLKI